MITDLTKAKKYDCPVKFTITGCEAGWVDIDCNFNGEVLRFAVSHIGDLPMALLEVAFLLHSIYDYNGGMFRYIRLDDETEGITDQDGHKWSAELGATFQWDEEPRLNKWHIYYEQKDFGKEDFDLIIKIDRITDIHKKYKFVVSYRDFCYAVAKLFTDALKKYGFWGYTRGSYSDYIVVKDLLIVKAYALGLLQTKIWYEGDYPKRDYFELPFEQELELLNFDM